MNVAKIGYFSKKQLKTTGSSIFQAPTGLVEATEVKTFPCSPSFDDAEELGSCGVFLRKGQDRADGWILE